MKAATAPATDCRRTATLTVRMSTRSGTIGSPGTIGKTLVWRSMATAAALARATMARTLSSGRGGRLGRRDRAARHQHLLELVEVDAGRDLRRLEEPLSALVDRDDAPDRKPLREDAVEPGGDELVADLHVFRPLDVLQHAATVDGALHDASRAGALHARVDPAVVIRAEEHARV